MGCGPGRTCHAACDCREAEWEAVGRENRELRDALEAERAAHAETRGAMAADDARLRDSAIRVWGEHIRGCDTPDEMAETILVLRESYGKAARRLAAAEDCLREIAKRLATAHHVIIRIDGRDVDGGWIAASARAFLAGGKP